MPGELFKLFGTIGIDNKDANKALQETSKEGENTKGKLSGAFDKIGKGALEVGKTIAKGLAAGATAMGALTIKALNLSGELEQNMGGSEAVFAEYAGKMQDTAKTAFESMGLSTSDFLATANKMGALFQGAGFDIESSANLSAQAMQRAADVASIMGIDIGSAMDSIAGAAKGNFTMMDNLGVAMNDTTIQAYALSKGIEKSTSDMTNQEKIGLAMEMFLEKTAYAAGNYSKENETLSGSLGTAKAALKNFLDGSGDVEQLVTAFQNAANVIIDNIDKILPRLIDAIPKINDKVIPMIPGLVNRILPSLLTSSVALIKSLVDALPSALNLIMQLLPDLIGAIVKVFNALVGALPEIIQIVVAALPGLVGDLVNGIIVMIITLLNYLDQIILPIILAIPSIVIAIVSALMDNLDVLIEGVVQLVVGIVSALPEITILFIQAIPTLISKIVSGIWNALPVLLSGIGQVIGSVFSSIGQLVSPFFSKVGQFMTKIWNTIKNAVSVGIKFIGSLLKAAFDIITLPFRAIWENCKDTIISVWEKIKNAVKTAINFVKDKIISPVMNAIKNVVTNIWNGIKSAIETPVNKIKSVVSTVFNRVKSTVTTIFNGVKSTVTTVWNGIKSAIETPINKAKSTVKSVVDSIKGFFSGLKLKLPDIKMPHFSIDGSFSLSPPSVPKLKIDWYKKAMQDAMVLNSPTIFGVNPSGQLMGAGEAGEEIVSGSNTLMNMIRATVRNENAQLANGFDRLIELLSGYFPEILSSMNREMVLDTGVLVGQIAPQIDNRLGNVARMRERGQ